MTMDLSTEIPASIESAVRSDWSHSDHVKRESRHIYNKLHSIAHDALFIHRVRALFPTLLITANLRCGAWYTDPAITSAVSYFKSTDGHMHQWSFSLKRSNLHLVPAIRTAGGAVVVDSTRRGKSMPDALSKTIPIWCAVLNGASKRKYGCPKGTQLETPTWMIPPTEHDQIEARIEGFITSLLESDLEVPRLEKPLKPVFITPQTDLDSLPPLADAKTRATVPIVLVSASKFVSDSADLPTAATEDAGRQAKGYVYVQGAGDDHENWARGLTPDVFWKHQAELLACEKDQLEAMVDRLVVEEASNRSGLWFTPLACSDGTFDGHGKGEDVQIAETGVFIGTRPADHPFLDEERTTYDLIIHFTTHPPPADTPLSDELGALRLSDSSPSATVYPIRMAPNKKGLSAIRAVFPPAMRLAHTVLAAQSSLSSAKVLLCCQEGKDLSGSLAVALLAECFTDQRRLITSSQGLESHRERITKDTTRRRLQWLVSASPRAAPSRAFLLRVNELLLSHRHRPSSDTA